MNSEQLTQAKHDAFDPTGGLAKRNLAYAACDSLAQTFLRSNVNTAYHGINYLQDICYGLSNAAGWHKTPVSNPETFATKIALMHSELSEALEGFRKDRMDDHLPHRKAVEVELADALIRILDTAGALNLDLAGAVMEKLVYNTRRADHKIENREAAGGKKF